MKHIYTLAMFCVLLCLSASAQSKIDLASRMALKQMRGELPYVEMKKGEIVTSRIAEPRMKTMAKGSVSIPRTVAIVTFKDGGSPSDLTAAGYEVLSSLRTVAVVRLPLDKIEDMARLDAVRTISLNQKMQPYLCYAHDYTGVNTVHEGFTYNSKDYSFTGKGVCTGIYDTGIYANHINFLDADGNSRIKMLTHYYEEEGDEENIYIDSYDNSNVSQFTSDSERETHGTHTLGILAGGYTGQGTFHKTGETAKSDGSMALTDTSTVKSNPHIGVAPESDILVSCGELWTAAAIDGFTRMANYAKDNGQPCVINYSAGSMLGAHDGTDALSLAMKELNEETGAIFCVSAGNDADYGKNSFQHTFTSAGEKYITCLTPNDYGQNIQALALFDIWSDDATPFDIAFSVYKPKTGIFGSATNKQVGSITAADSQVYLINKASSNYPDATVSSDMNSCFNTSYTSVILAYSEINQASGRYHVMGQIIYVRPFVIQSRPTASFIYLTVTGRKAGQIVRAAQNQPYADFTAQSTISGSVDGTNAYTINNLACGTGAISVGSFDSHSTYYTFASSDNLWGTNSFTSGGVTGFSSFGPGENGRQLPEILGPGNVITSSYNTEYVNFCETTTEEGYTDKPTEMVGKAVANGNTYYWGTMSGTSMSSPYVAGTIALWLQVNPDLSLEEIREIFQLTSTMDENLEATSDRAGYGRINALEGVKEVLRRIGSTGLRDITADKSSLIITQEDSKLTVFLAGETALKVNLYNVQGAMMTSVTSSGDNIEIDTSGLTKGIYIVEAMSSTGGRSISKIAIR